MTMSDLAHDGKGAPQATADGEMRILRAFRLDGGSLFAFTEGGETSWAKDRGFGMIYAPAGKAMREVQVLGHNPGRGRMGMCVDTAWGRLSVPAGNRPGSFPTWNGRRCTEVDPADYDIEIGAVPHAREATGPRL